MGKLIPKEELVFHNYEPCTIVADILLSEGYVVMISREENLYVLNYIWSGAADRNDTVFMCRDEFECNFYEDPDYAEDSEYAIRDKIRENTRRNTEREVWYYAQKLMNSRPTEIEKIFGLEQMSDEAKDMFWESYPNQLSYDEVKTKYQAYNDKLNAEIGEKVMEACLADLDKHNQDKYERIMREEYQCEGQYVMDEFDGQST